jgi:hypothetical protein
MQSSAKFPPGFQEISGTGQGRNNYTKIPAVRLPIEESVSRIRTVKITPSTLKEPQNRAFSRSDVIVSAQLITIENGILIDQQDSPPHHQNDLDQTYQENSQQEYPIVEEQINEYITKMEFEEGTDYDSFLEQSTEFTSSNEVDEMKLFPKLSTTLEIPKLEPGSLEVIQNKIIEHEIAVDKVLDDLLVKTNNTEDVYKYNY